MRRSPAMTVMIRAAEKAGRAVIRDFGEVEQLQASQRGPKDFVAKAEAKSDEVIRRNASTGASAFRADASHDGRSDGGGHVPPVHRGTNQWPCEFHARSAKLRCIHRA